MDMNPSEWTNQLVAVLEHVSRGSQLNQGLSPWLWNCGIAQGVMREGPMQLCTGMGQYVTTLTTGPYVVMHTERILP